jgi:hypothetical protein
MAEDWDIARIRSESGDENAHFLDGPVRAAIYTRQDEGRPVCEPVRVKRALAVGGLLLIETEDNPDDWYMGQKARTARFDAGGVTAPCVTRFADCRRRGEPAVPCCGSGAWLKSQVSAESGDLPRNQVSNAIGKHRPR